MDEIKDTTNPVGTSSFGEEIQNFIEAMKALWDSSNPTIPWWKFWKKVNFARVVNFLIGCLDQLIEFVEQTAIPGPDKKATVLEAVGKIYDYIIAEAMPFWLRPFSGKIRNFIINVLISNFIDWSVAKYKKGSWRPTPKEQLAAQWFSLKVNLTGQ